MEKNYSSGKEMIFWEVQKKHKNLAFAVPFIIDFYPWYLNDSADLGKGPGQAYSLPSPLFLNPWTNIALADLSNQNRSVQPFLRLKDTYKQTDRQAIFLFITFLEFEKKFDFWRKKCRFFLFLLLPGRRAPMGSLNKFQLIRSSRLDSLVDIHILARALLYREYIRPLTMFTLRVFISPIKLKINCGLWIKGEHR